MDRVSAALLDENGLSAAMLDEHHYRPAGDFLVGQNHELAACKDTSVLRTYISH